MAVAWWVWVATVLAFAGLIAGDLYLSRAGRHVSFATALRWSGVYVGLALLFCVGLLVFAGSTPAVEFLTGFAVEKTLSVDNLFVFTLALTGFAVAERYQARVLMIGIIGALLMRVVLIVVGVSAVERFSFLFLVFGAFLCVAAVRLVRTHGGPPDVTNGRVLRWVRRRVPIVEDNESGSLVVRKDGKLALTTLALAALAILSVDVVFALDSIPAILGITNDIYLVLCANVFALLGLRPLYFVLIGLQDRLVHLHYGLAIVLGFIGVKLALHYLHTIVPALPEIPTVLSLAVIVLVLAVTTVTSLRAKRREPAREPERSAR
jgi:tellurite resistance protein TerC